MENCLDFLLFNPFSEGITGIILGIIGWVSFLLLIGVFIYLILCILDEIWLPKETGQGVIVKKEFKAAHGSTQLIPISMMSPMIFIMPILHHHDDCWSIIIEVNGIQGEFDVNEDDYNKLEIGQKLNLTYSWGRIFISVLVKSWSK